MRRPPLLDRLEDAIDDKALDIGTAWNLLQEARDEIERLEQAILDREDDELCNITLDRED